MAIFREFDSEGRDRSLEDRRRHRQLMEESIKKNIGSIIAEESIIGQNRDKKIRVPIRGIREYRFIYGKNAPGVGSGDGSEHRGDIIGEERPGQKGNGTGQVGSQEGEEVFETEITIEELIQYLFDDLKLPDIDRTKLAEIESSKSLRNKGYQRKGIPPRLAKKRSVVEKIKRRQGTIRSRRELEGDAPQDKEGLQGMEERFPFMEEDLRYRRVRETVKKEFNAIVICIMDVSGSMDRTKKFIARSFYFLLYQFIRLKYTHVEVIFIAHTTTAKEVSERDFFHRGESGGTYISSGYAKALEIIEQRYNPANWNIYAFHCSDGDNWTEDNQRAVELAQKLCETCNLFGYGEIVPGYYSAGSTIKSEYRQHIGHRNFALITMSKKEDILSGLKKLLEKENTGSTDE